MNTLWSYSQALGFGDGKADPQPLWTKPSYASLFATIFDIEKQVWSFEQDRPGMHLGLDKS